MELDSVARYKVVHDTRYEYSGTVNNGYHFTHLAPRNTVAQSVVSHEQLCEPAPAENHVIIDYFGNETRSFRINVSHDTLLVSAHSSVEVFNPTFDAGLLAQPWENALPPPLPAFEQQEVAEMRLPSQHVECLVQSEGYSRRFFQPGRSWLEAMLELTRSIKEEFVYDPAATTIYTPVSTVFDNRQGVCQDFAHLMLSCLRAQRLPARYVSGYILNEPPPGKEKLVGGDASHAWIESWLPGAGWIGFDPTNGKQVNNEFVIVAWGRDYMDVTPLRGVVLGGGQQKMEVSVSVTRV